MNKFEKFFNTVKKHLISSLAIFLGAVALIMTGVSFLSSYLNYVSYSENYEKTKKELLANTPQLPEEVVKDNEFVVYDDAAGDVSSHNSEFGSTYIFGAHDATIELDNGEEAEFETIEGTSWDVATGFTVGGSMTFTINTAINGMSDIDIYLGLGEVKNIPIDNLIDFITIKINGLPITTVDFNLPKDGSLQQLVLKNTNLIKGENKLEFATTVSDGSSSNNFIMPAIAAVTVMTDVAMA